MRAFIMFAAFSMFQILPASAQGVFNPNQIPVRFPTASTAERNAAGSAALLRHQRAVERRCAKSGCVLLETAAPHFAITEFRYDTGGGAWGRNELVRRTTKDRPYLLFPVASGACQRGVRLTATGSDGNKVNRTIQANFCQKGVQSIVLNADLSITNVL